MRVSGLNTTLTAKVGMFWCINDTDIGEAVPLDEAEPYGDALQLVGITISGLS